MRIYISKLTYLTHTNSSDDAKSSSKKNTTLSNIIRPKMLSIWSRIQFSLHNNQNRWKSIGHRHSYSAQSIGVQQPSKRVLWCCLEFVLCLCLYHFIYIFDHIPFMYSSEKKINSIINIEIKFDLIFTCVYFINSST